MNQDIEAVANLLEDINNSYVRMIELSEKKKGYLIRADAQAVGETVKEEWELLKEINGLEKHRMQAVGRLCKAWNMQDGEATLEEIINRAEGEMRVRIKKTRDALKTTIARQKNLIDQNKRLLMLHFEYMDFMVGILLGDTGNSIYGQSGAMQETNAGNVGILDSHI